MSQNRETKRFLGLELAGAKNQKTSLAVLEFYPKEQKTFLLDIFDRISGHEDQSGDEAVLEVIQEENTNVVAMGVNVPLELPPCITCVRKTCPLPSNCSVSSVKWMRDLGRKITRSSPEARFKEFTPYTQRPVELWIKHHVLPLLAYKTPQDVAIEIDEALGGNRAPLTARMNFLKRQLTQTHLVEVWPKISIALLAERLGFPRRMVASYRHLENGAYYREEILLNLTQKMEIFIYDRDLRKLSQSLTAFDAFICALTALLDDQNQCAPHPKGFPLSSGWVRYPRLEL